MPVASFSEMGVMTFRFVAAPPEEAALAAAAVALAAANSAVTLARRVPLSPAGSADAGDAFAISMLQSSRGTAQGNWRAPTR